MSFDHWAFNRRQGLKAVFATVAGSALGAFGASLAAQAQSRADTLRHVLAGTPNTLDPTAPGATRESFGLSTGVYDRLAAYGRKQVNGSWVYDFDNIRGELAEKIDRSADGRTFTFHLRQGATWHDGSPVTAADVKWSLDRAVSAKSLAAGQMATGSLEKPEQFKVVGEGTVEVSLDKPDRLALANLAVPLSPMFNSTLARANATADDPWAQTWLKENTAGGGAYVVEQYKSGQHTILRRNETWKNGVDGKLAFFQKVIAQTVPEAATRANLIERGDADLAIDLQASDIATLTGRGAVKLVATPQINGFAGVVFNTRMAPMDNPKVRAALAAALPYEAMFEAALFGRGRPLFGADWTEAPNGAFPQRLPFRTDPAKAKALLAEAGFPDGFETTFSFSSAAASTGEPMATLIKEALAEIGVKVSIQKLPPAQMATLEVERRMPFFLSSGTAWLPAPDYFLRTYFTGERRWNLSGYVNPELDALAEAARFETDPATYEASCRRMIDIVAEEAPMIMVWQPNQDAVMAPSIDGYTYWFHGQVDYRDLYRA